MNEKLLELRQKIDAIDEEIFSLLMKRVNIVEEVGELKRAQCEVSSIIRNGREAIMIRNIFNKIKERGFEDKIAYGFANIWRNIICVSINIEQDTKIAVHSEKTAMLSREYMGNFLNPVQLDSSIEAVEALKARQANIAVVDVNDEAWWLWLSNNNDFKIFATLPFIKGSYRNIFAIAKTEPEETGFDTSLYVTKEKIPGAEILAEFEGNFLNKVKGYKTSDTGIFIGSFAEQF